jgi:uncharacterized membrane protein YhaH (DUF805 family)
MKYMIMPLRRYADFSGRSRRMEYWMFALFLMIVAAVVIIPLAIMAGHAPMPDGAPPFGIGAVVLFSIGVIAIFIPSLAVQVRRLHDQNRTGWLVLLGFIPYIGGIIMLVFMLIPGTRGENDYGSDPKQSNDDFREVFR